ncbi:sodium- and chloride-dependent glycine transporter 1-like isoform X2 [Drosophila eugracilis]|uniref:sodium- and chloride-dependent glycine transporter 1-like isoform X2 n=1 Tax=Drosophila eugracilis TaxID=29029 RepID=UPI001BDACA44|nr:sodium- and chloride-dependent glycine transporter 1-like isoform X2 [Drosophila eugracilis]
MVYDSPDLNRGKWEKPTDYIFACLGLALSPDIFAVFLWWFSNISKFGIFNYFVYMVICLVPILLIHSFVGQFSSSGFISAFRLSPLFKGMGYVTLFLTISIVIYYSIFAAYSLFFVVNSLRPTLPWSCDGYKFWHKNNTAEFTTCNLTVPQDFDSYEDHPMHNAPSELYIHHFASIQADFDLYLEDLKIHWQFVGFFVLVWAMIAVIFYKFRETAKFGKLMRYMVIGTLSVLLVCFVRFSFLPGTFKGLTIFENAYPDVQGVAMGIGSTLILVVHAFGAGWGSVIALSSFNGFRTNIMSYSWIISFGQIFIFIMFGMVHFMIQHYRNEPKGPSGFFIIRLDWDLMGHTSALSTLEWPNLWTFLYYSMFLMAALIGMSTQIFTVLQSLFDEFEELRKRKMQVTFGLIGGLSVCSLFFCTNRGISLFSHLGVDAIFTHSVLNFLLLLVVLWVYGRQRFQRDIEFMLGQPFASWKVFILRFIAPIIFLIGLFAGIYFYSFYDFGLSIIYIIPVYGVYYLYQSNGTFSERFRRTCRPTNWYPVEMDHRQQYEEAAGNTEMKSVLISSTGEQEDSQ